MMPSRGAQLARCHLQPPRRCHPQCRNLSSTPRIPFHHRSHGPLLSTTRSSLPRRTAIAVTVSTVLITRHASTTPAAAATAASTSTTTEAPPIAASLPPTSDTPLFSSIDTITLDNVGVNDAIEGVGYLRQLGLDYGSGPTSVIQWLLENAHFTLGLPWWATIFATGVGLRVVMAPLFIRSADALARQSAMLPVTKPITDEMSRLRKEGKVQDAMVLMKRISVIRKQAGISTMAMYTPMVLQAVIGYCGFKLMRAMANLPVPGLDNGGFLWLSDLTVTDPFLITPVLMGLAIHCVVRLGGESGTASVDAMGQNMRQVMLYGMPAIIVLATVWQPGAVVVWFMSTGIVGLSQGLLLQRPAVRHALGIAPIYKPAPGEGSPWDAFSAMFPDNGSKNQIKTNIAPDTVQSTQTSSPGSMNPQYQAPRQTGVIDVKLANKPSPDASTPGLGRSPATAPSASSPSKSPGIVGQLKGRYQQARDEGTKWAKGRAEQQQSAAKALREEKAYEARAARVKQMKKKKP